MRCRYGTGDEATWLTGLPWQEDVGEIQWQGQQATSATPIIGSATPSIRSLGNAADTLPVQIVLGFDSELEALRYCAEILWDLPGAGQLVFIDQAGTEQLTITYPKAVFANVTRNRKGRSVHLAYNFIVTGPPSISVVSDAPLRIYSESGQPITTES
jgi:hypothetical protein